MRDILDKLDWEESQWSGDISDSNDFMEIMELEAELGVELEQELTRLEKEMKAELEAEIQADIEALKEAS